LDALIGHTGFVGGNILRQHAFGALFNSRNIADIAGQHFGTLVFAGAQGKKWWANQNPEADWAGIAGALDALAGVEAERVILISTIDVVPPVAGADETFDCASLPNHAYGTNRLRLETALRERFGMMTVIRLPALTGVDLRKNIVYDLIHDNQVDRIDPVSRFQFYDLDRLWDDIGVAIAAGIDLVHLVTEPVLTGDIVGHFFPGAKLGPSPAGGSAFYDFRTRHDRLFGGAHGYIYDEQEVMRRLGAFITAAKGASA
jgi:hypothetical protein